MRSKSLHRGSLNYRFYFENSRGRLNGLRVTNYDSSVGKMRLKVQKSRLHRTMNDILMTFQSRSANSKSQKHILQIVCRKSNTRNFNLIYIFTGANLKLNCRVNAKTNERCMPRTPSFPFLTESPFPYAYILAGMRKTNFCCSDVFPLIQLPLLHFQCLTFCSLLSYSLKVASLLEILKDPEIDIQTFQNR